MKKLTCLTIAICASVAMAINVFGGPEPLPSGKEMKEVAPAPPPMCEWGGFYVGLHAGGQFGHSQTSERFTIEVFGTSVTEDLPRFGYDEDGFNGGMQFGYNFQWHR